jgi:YcfA-like protein.
MTGSELVTRLVKVHGCTKVRQKSSHVRIACGPCNTTVVVHVGEDIGKGLMSAIRRDLVPCLGKGWWK